MYRRSLCWVSLFRDRIACLCSQNVGITDVCSPSFSKVHTLSYNQAPVILCLTNLKPLCWLNSLPLVLYRSIQPLSCCDWLTPLSSVFSLSLLCRIRTPCCGRSVCQHPVLSPTDISAAWTFGWYFYEHRLQRSPRRSNFQFLQMCIQKWNYWLTGLI